MMYKLFLILGIAVGAALIAWAIDAFYEWQTYRKDR